MRLFFTFNHLKTKSKCYCTNQSAIKLFFRRKNSMENYGFVKTAIANFDGKIGDPASNAKKIKELIDQAERQNVKILVLPELCLTSYTCKDLFVTSNLMEKALRYLKEIVDYTLKKSSLLVLVGAPLQINDVKYNCAVAIKNGLILGVVPKRYIPNYNEYEERRFFSPYVDFNCKEINLFGKKVPFGNLIFSSSCLGYRLGVEICEDLWAPISPSSELTLAGANIIANLSASNEVVGKDDFRRDLIKIQSAKTVSAYLYTSASATAESTADLVFGGSGYVYENGKALASLERFQFKDQMAVVDVDVDYLTNERDRLKTFADSKSLINSSDFTVVNVDSAIYPNFLLNYVVDDAQCIYTPSDLRRYINPHPFIPNIMDKAGGKVCKEILKIQSIGLAKRLSHIGCKKVTIGVSGGLDSTLALLVCYEAFKMLGLDTKGILGITMPGFGTTDRTYNNSLKLCEQLGTTLEVIPIKDVCLQHFKDIKHDPAVHDVTYENVQARERTNILMNLANKKGGILVGTGDLSESILGWCTFNGDHMSMYNVNCSIPKTLVKYLIEWYARFGGTQKELQEVLLDIIDTPISPELLPTDGKKIVQKTESAVGPYELNDFFTYYFIRNRVEPKKMIFLAQVAFKNKYLKAELINHYNNFAKRFFNNQFKRDTVPNGPKVSSISVSPRGDWRMPSDAGYSCWLYTDED